jgi:hypothetical protein
MFMVNTYRWDYPQVAALVAPRPLLISNTDSDGIFPLDGVVRTFDKIRRIYRLFDSEKRGTSANLALNIEPGPHKDTQELQTNEFRWFNHYLKHDDSPIDSRAPKYFQPEQLKVFDKLPEDQINTKIHETFVAKAEESTPQTKDNWQQARDEWITELEDRCYRAWPTSEPRIPIGSQYPFSPPKHPGQTFSVDHDGIRFQIYQVISQEGIQLELYVLHRADLERPELNVLTILDDAAWTDFLATRPGFEEQIWKRRVSPPLKQEAWDSTKKMLASFPWVMTFLCPRGVGPTAFNQTEKKQVQNRRRYYLLGQTLDETQIWDVRRAIQSVREIKQLENVPLWLQSSRSTAGVALYASLFEPDIKRLDLYDLPTSHRSGPYFLNVERFLDMPQAVAMAAERSKIVLYQDDDAGWDYPQAVAKALGWDAKQIQIRRKPTDK